MTRAALYLRISSDQTGQALGVTRQREDCQAAADAAGWTVAETYVDNDISAYKDRPAYNRLLEDIKAGRIDAIIAWAPDRMYRRLKDLETLIEIIETHKVEIRTVKAGDLDLSGAYGRMLARILGSVAAGEGEIKSERWRRSWRQRREAGDYAKNGTRAFGYTADGEVVEDEAEVAQWMAAEILAGKPILSVCRELKSLGITTTWGNDWTPQGLKRYLMNPRIAGWSAMGIDVPISKRDKDGKQLTRRDWNIVSEGLWTPLIDRETYEGVKALLSARTRPYVPRKALLTGILFCGREGCGHRMITSGQKGIRTYRCPKRPGTGMDGCGRCSGNADPIEEVVELFTKLRLADPAVREHIGRMRANDDGGPYAELAAVELRIVELEKRLDDPGLSLDAVMRALDRARETQTELQGQIKVRSNVVIPPSDAAWPTDILSRRQLVDLVAERVVLLPATRASRLGFDADRVEIVDRYPMKPSD